MKLSCSCVESILNGEMHLSKISADLLPWTVETSVRICDNVGPQPVREQ